MKDVLVIAALYEFRELPHYAELRPKLTSFCQNHGIQGTLILAKEGINGTVCGSRQAIDALHTLLEDEGFHQLSYKESFSSPETKPFYRMKVKLKKEIVTMGFENVNPLERVGTYLDANEWNVAISDPEVFLIDTRNDYEFSVGTFQGAVNPETDCFRDFPLYVERHLDPSKHKKVAMFCTGGIRCEKASSYLLQKGFQEVYHLKGGILQYLEDVERSKSLWNGECFVFDNRITVDQDLQAGHYDVCYACRHVLSQEDKESAYYWRGISCHHCHDKLTERQKASVTERQKQMLLAKKRGENHLGMNRAEAKQRKEKARMEQKRRSEAGRRAAVEKNLSQAPL